jgi:hypothetical protein
MDDIPIPDEVLRESNFQKLNTLKGNLHKIRDEVLQNLSTAETTQNKQVKTDTITNAESVLRNLLGLGTNIVNVMFNANEDEEVMQRVGTLNGEYSELQSEISGRINGLRAQLGGQRSKIKKRRFKSYKSNKTNKSKGRKRSSRRRRISRKRSKKC